MLIVTFLTKWQAGTLPLLYIWMIHVFYLHSFEERFYFMIVFCKRDLFSFLSLLGLCSTLMCAEILQKTKSLTQCPKNVSQQMWLALRPLVQLNHQTTFLALKGETKHSGPLCVVLPVVSIPTSRRHPCYSCTAHSHHLFFYIVFCCF